MLRKTLMKTENSTAVCMADLSAALSFEPKLCEMMTCAPVASPLKNPMTPKTSWPVEPTAARASRPRKRPTMRQSVVLYSCWKMFPASRGRVKRTICGRIAPASCPLPAARPHQRQEGSHRQQCYRQRTCCSICSDKYLVSYCIVARLAEKGKEKKTCNGRGKTV